MPRIKPPVVLSKLPTKGWTAPITSSLLKTALIDRDRDGTPLFSEVSITDKVIDGFTLRVRVKVVKGEHAGRARWTEVKSFMFRWRKGKMPLGLATADTLPEARTRALAARLDVDNGIDPRGPRKLAKEVPTLAEAKERWLKLKRSKKRAESTLVQYTRAMNRWAKRLGTRKVNAITLRDVEDLHLELEDKPVEADHMVRTLRIFLNWASSHWTMPPNPCKGFELYGDQERDRPISREELSGLAAASNSLLGQGRIGLQAHHLFWILLLTGARQVQVYGLKWGQVDFEKRLIFFRPKDPKGRRKTRRRADIRPMTEVVIALLKDLELNQENHGVYVFPGRNDENAATRNIFVRQWHLIRTTAQASEVWLNDLRHHWGTLAAELRLSPLVTQRLMGHEQITTTQRYMAFRHESLRSGADSVTAEVLQRAGTIPSLTKPPLPQPLFRLWECGKIPGEPTLHPSATQLEVLVQALPLREIAIFFGLTDKGMAKRCQAAGVNTVARGYWLQAEPARRAEELRIRMKEKKGQTEPRSMDSVLRQSLATALSLAGLPWTPEELMAAAKACDLAGLNPQNALKKISH